MKLLKSKQLFCVPVIKFITNVEQHHIDFVLNNAIEYVKSFYLISISQADETDINYNFIFCISKLDIKFLVRKFL
jgi:hypothetical protein